jgi:hypothetical protein
MNENQYCEDSSQGCHKDASLLMPTIEPDGKYQVPYGDRKSCLLRKSLPGFETRRQITRLAAYSPAQTSQHFIELPSTTHHLVSPSISKDVNMADAAGVLSAGVLRGVTEGQVVENPIVQCVQIKPMSANQATGQERWRVVFNDSINFMQGMLASRTWFKRRCGDE